MKNVTVPQSNSSSEMDFLLNTMLQYGPKIVQNKPLIKLAMSNAEKRIKRDTQKQLQNDPMTPPGVMEDKAAMGLAILNSAKRVLLEQKVSPATIEKATTLLGRDLFIGKSLRTQRSVEFSREYGYTTPSFLVISPSKACNLRCTGCYADSDEQTKILDWDTVDRIISDAYDLWGTQFYVISGGEPMAYRSQGKGILDLAEKHDNCYFMMYTNGTLITPEVAERMGRLGNVVPAISLEGWKDRTDARRGEGVFDKVMQAMDSLYDAGVLYGNSLTATRENAEELLSDEFIEFLFEKKHSRICWIFQYMPIGRSFTLDLMPTPEQRLWMWRKSWQFIHEKQYFLADFWNHGTAVGGCLSAGGHSNGGYFYIEWNGNVTPCVFVPYSPVNVKTIYEQGGTLNDIYAHPFFSGIRDWQSQCMDQQDNLMHPCLIRDNNKVLRNFIRKHEAEPIDANAAAAILDPKYAAGMDQYALEYSQLSDPVWQKVYLQHEALNDDEFAALQQHEMAELTAK